MVSSSSSVSSKYEGTASLDCPWKKISAVSKKWKSSGMLVSDPVRGTFSVKVSDSSVGGVPVGYCPDEVHMEEEVQLKVQVEEKRIGEAHGKEQGGETGSQRTDNTQALDMDDHADEMTRTNTFLSHAV